MFHNVLMTSLTPLRDTNEINCWDNRPFTKDWPEEKQEKPKDVAIKKTIKKKNKRNRTMFTTEQVRTLEKIFARTKYIDVERRKEIAEHLQIEQKCIKIWFQNRRMKEKKELSESGDSANEGTSESSSPPLEASQPSSCVPDNQYTHSHVDAHVKPERYYYYAPNNYLNAEASQYHQSNYETSNNPGVYENIDANVFRNDLQHSFHYYPSRTDFAHYYNTGYVDNQYVRNVQDWQVNTFDTNYNM